MSGGPVLRRGFARAVRLTAVAAAIAVAAVGSSRAAVPAAVGIASAADRPYGLPFSEPSSMATWTISQPYGNTVYAYFERHQIYRSGQGLHMGLDFACACGTTVVAIADGVVQSIDGPGGAPPHNLMIAHPDGFVSFYGHLLERPALEIGQSVARGQPVALSGDMYETCYSSPHLHLEIRDASLQRLFNPVQFIDADWHSLLLYGSGPLSYERELSDPRRWQSFDDQPPIQLGGALLNEFAQPYPSGEH
ncbi:MAG: M23 family metallopeptidase [Ardenticatenales bacterium]|nr:M23 family metallopeptidase [Ardenticatenales bacterium]